MKVAIISDVHGNRLALEAVLARDFSVLLGVLLLSSLLVILANIAIDLLHAWLDPRIGEA